MSRFRTVLYVYKCTACGRRGEQRLDDDSHDGEASTCGSCGAPVTLEWDGGVTLETPKTIADEVIERARGRK
jgi:DNA-directed RNA polymerase subunit RPC12/RpoP